MFRYKTGINVDYNRQGYIYFVSRNYEGLTRRQQETIWKHCCEVGDGNCEALFEFVTTDAPATEICLKHYIASATTLYRLVKRYYEEFPKKL